MKKLSIEDYRVEYKKMYQNDCSVVEYAFLWCKDPNMIQNPPEIPDEDIKTIKDILSKHSVFEFKINLNI